MTTLVIIGDDKIEVKLLKQFINAKILRFYVIDLPT